MTASYDCNCAVCDTELEIIIEGGYLWDGEFACEKCVEE
tara:strand:- start:3348 stop:3464 length:117 start_codon:yes stop_codon:yes gene_type:complete